MNYFTNQILYFNPTFIYSISATFIQLLVKMQRACLLSADEHAAKKKKSLYSHFMNIYLKPKDGFENCKYKLLAFFPKAGTGHTQLPLSLRKA